MKKSISNILALSLTLSSFNAFAQEANEKKKDGLVLSNKEKIIAGSAAVTIGTGLAILQQRKLDKIASITFDPANKVDPALLQELIKKGDANTLNALREAKFNPALLDEAAKAKVDLALIHELIKKGDANTLNALREAKFNPALLDEAAKAKVDPALIHELLSRSNAATVEELAKARFSTTTEASSLIKPSHIIKGAGFLAAIIAIPTAVIKLMQRQNDIAELNEATKRSDNDKKLEPFFTESKERLSATKKPAYPNLASGSRRSQ